MQQHNRVMLFFFWKIILLVVLKRTGDGCDNIDRDWCSLQCAHTHKAKEQKDHHCGAIPPVLEDTSRRDLFSFRSNLTEQNRKRPLVSQRKAEYVLHLLPIYTHAAGRGQGRTETKFQGTCKIIKSSILNCTFTSIFSVFILPWCLSVSHMTLIPKI